MSAYEDAIIDMEVILTEEQLDAIMDDMMAEGWGDPAELEWDIEEPQLDSESGFDQEFLRDCN